MRYREVVRMPIWLLALIYFFLLSLVISIWAALGNNPALISLVLSTLLLVFIAFKSAMVIEVEEDQLRVGRAHIEIEFLGKAQPLTVQETRDLRTRDADPAAYLGIRFWSSKGVRVDVTDVRDSTPYWLISSKNPQRLAEILNSVGN